MRPVVLILLLACVSVIVVPALAGWEELAVPPPLEENAVWMRPDYSRSPEPALKAPDLEYMEYTRSLPQGEYQICFYSDDSLPIGHGFIKILFPDGTMHGFGFYPPETGLWGRFFNSPGKMERDNTHEWDWKICYKVNRSTAVTALDTARAWRFGTYHLFDSNCVHFVDHVANQTGLAVAPNGTPERPGTLATGISQLPGAIKNANKDKTREMVFDPMTGTWMREDEQRAAARLRGKTARPDTAGPGMPLIGSRIETPDDLKNLVNGKVAAVPADLQKLAADKRVLLVVTGDGGERNTIGFTFLGTTVTGVEPGVEKPDYRVYATDQALTRIFAAEDPVTTYRTALGRGEIRIEPAAPADMALIGGSGFLNKASLLLTPSPFLIRKGEQKDLALNGKTYTLLRPMNILLQEKGSTDATVISSDGAAQGYTTTGIVRAITLSPQKHTTASGVYTRPATGIGDLAVAGFGLPDDQKIVTPSPAESAVLYTLQGGADPAHLVAGGAGFAYGYGEA